MYIKEKYICIYIYIFFFLLYYMTRKRITNRCACIFPGQRLKTPRQHRPPFSQRKQNLQVASYPVSPKTNKVSTSAAKKTCR